MHKIVKVEPYYDITSDEAEFDVFMNFPSNTRLYNKKYNEPTFCEFGYQADKKNVKHYVYSNGKRHLMNEEDNIESAEWTTHLIADVFDTNEKFIWFAFRVWFYDEDDWNSALEHFNDDDYWNMIFKWISDIPIKINENIKLQIINKWNEFKEKCYKAKEEYVITC